jgi:hypothetical protein
MSDPTEPDPPAEPWRLVLTEGDLLEVQPAPAPGTPPQIILTLPPWRATDLGATLDRYNLLTAIFAEPIDVAPAGLLLADRRGVLHVLAASSEEIHSLEVFQLRREQGPCLDCHHSGAPVSATDLRQETTRCPQFVAAAAEAGFATPATTTNGSPTSPAPSSTANCLRANSSITLCPEPHANPTPAEDDRQPLLASLRRRAARALAGGACGIAQSSASVEAWSSGAPASAEARHRRGSSAPGRTDTHVVAAFPQPVERLAIPERDRRLQPIAVRRLREVQHPVDRPSTGTGREMAGPGVQFDRVDDVGRPRV